jgi:hypothetical protein
MPPSTSLSEDARVGRCRGACSLGTATSLPSATRLAERGERDNRLALRPARGIAAPKESTAWMATGVHYRDRAASDPPNATLSRLKRHGMVVFAVVYESGRVTENAIELRLDHAKRYPCCDGTYVAGGEYELDGAGPATADSVIVRVYFGSAPTRSMRKQAQLALNRLQLPAPR